MIILSGDVGGTKTRLALFEARGNRLDLDTEQTFASRDYPSLEGIAEGFLKGRRGRVDGACFGIPGPVRDGRAEVTNLPWLVEAGRLAKELGIPAVALLNDLEALGHGVLALEESELRVLHRGTPDATGNAGLIAAGTGLGEAGLFRDGEALRPFPSEGGHADFAPSTDLEIELLRHLRGRFGGHVSWERVLSGPGLVNIYGFLREHRGSAEPSWLTEQMRGGDPAAAVSQAGLAGRCPVCSEALDVFVRLYGAEAGNLALKLKATAGVYVGGGIAPKILERLEGPGFIDAFRAKGRMSSLLQDVPVRVVLSDRAVLLGPARYAAQRAGA
jgi:glucokinase